MVKNGAFHVRVWNNVNNNSNNKENTHLKEIVLKCSDQIQYEPPLFPWLIVQNQ